VASLRPSKGVLPHWKIFDLSVPFSECCTSRKDRNFLISRLTSFVNRTRRGGLSLPPRFRTLEARLSNWTRGEIRQLMYAVRPDASADHRLSKSMVDTIRRDFPGMIWTTTNQINSMANRVDIHRLGKRQYPRISRSIWPSTPTISEVVGMARCGISTRGLWKVPIGRNGRMELRHVRDCPAVATRIVSDNIIGIRDCVSVPPAFRLWFRQRAGMLFLCVRHKLPIGLVRFLISQWITNPFSLWLKVNCRIKQYLKLYDSPKWVVGSPSNWFYQSNGRLGLRQDPTEFDRTFVRSHPDYHGYFREDSEVEVPASNSKLT